MEEKEIKPRFKIQKTPLSGGEEKTQAEDFAPEKILYVEIDDEITMVFDQLKKLKQKKIALSVPHRATLFQSIVNLKILKKKIDEMEKDVIIITADPAGLALAEKAGIPSITRLLQKEERTKKPEPLPPLRGERPVRASREKVSLAQIIRHDAPSFIASALARAKEYLRKKKAETSKTKLVLVTPNKQALLTLILVSVLLLLTIAYIALPGATVYLTPKSSILDPSFNVTFLDAERNRDALEAPFGNTIVIPSHRVAPLAFEKKLTHPATGKVFRGENARGTIIITNLSIAPWDLAARTRFQTKDGIIFRTPSAVRVPAAAPSGAGKLPVTVIADEFDANGQITGTRGNIPPSKFFLPGLKNEENKQKLFGESFEPMTGGITKTVKIVSKEDIEAAKEAARRQVQKEAADDLRKYLAEQNLVNKTNLTLLADRNLIKISEPAVDVPAGLEGKQAEQFEVAARYTASGIAYDRELLVAALKERIISRVDPDKKILKVEENDISYKFLDEDAAKGRARLTATMRAIQMYELDPEKENGHRFLKKITDHIAGMNVKDALEYLQQQTEEIVNVEIKTWPVWAPTIPNIAENIKFVVREENIEP